MIPISSQSPTLPSHNSLNYELLSLTAICGEVPCAGSSRLTASESYRKKVVTSLTHDKLLRIFSSHHLRGYRLGVRTKRLLLQQEPERFAFYLSGCSDTNAIKSEVPRRIRLHRIAQTYVTMLNAGTMIYRDEKPPIFSPAASGPFHIEQPYFYDSREMKEAELEMLKIRGSRMAGALFTSNRVFAVYNSMEFLPVFEPQVEMRSKVMLEQVYIMTSVGNNDRGTLIVPDSVTASLEKDVNALLVQYEPNADSNEILQKMIPIGLDSTHGYRYAEKNMMYETFYGLDALVSFLCCYIGLVFLLICAALLALKQLTETTDNVYRYGLLQKLGAGRRQIDHTLFVQTVVFFAIPLVVAGVYSAFLIGKAMAVVEEFMNIHIATNIGLTIVLFLLVYGSYFLATYLSCKRIVTEQRELEV